MRITASGGRCGGHKEKWGRKKDKKKKIKKRELKENTQKTHKKHA